MQYLGGKKRLAKHIAAILEAHRSDGQRFVDVFCGSLAITAAMSDRGPRVANDGCVPLIRLYAAWREGWRPPTITEDLYREIKAKQDPDDPLTAFVGFGCSYSGKWFGGFARGLVKAGTRSRVGVGYAGAKEPADFADTTARSLHKLVQPNVLLTSHSFSELLVETGDLVYCDPEYRSTTAYGYFTRFDYDLFLTKLHEWAQHCDVFVSEYEAQSPTWELIAEWDVRKSRLKGRQVERLYRVHACEVTS